MILWLVKTVRARFMWTPAHVDGLVMTVMTRDPLANVNAQQRNWDRDRVASVMAMNVPSTLSQLTIVTMAVNASHFTTPVSAVGIVPTTLTRSQSVIRSVHKKRLDRRRSARAMVVNVCHRLSVGMAIREMRGTGVIRVHVSRVHGHVHSSHVHPCAQMAPVVNRFMTAVVAVGVVSTHLRIPSPVLKSVHQIQRRLPFVNVEIMSAFSPLNAETERHVRRAMAATRVPVKMVGGSAHALAA